MTTTTKKSPVSLGHIIDNDVELQEGIFVREIGPRSKGRVGEITKIMKVYAEVKMEDGTYFRKKKDYLKVTSVVEETEERSFR